MNVVIIGGGVAGTLAAEQLRKLNEEAKIAIISDEKHRMYSRVLLPKVINGEVDRERIFLKKESWYGEQQIDLVFDEVVEIDTENKQVVTATQTSYAYDKLLIAGGGVTRRLPISEQENVFHFQTVDDADAIKAKLQELEGKTDVRAGVIGGGFISVEFIEFFAARKFDTHVYLRGEKFFSKSLDEESSALFEKHLESFGVQIHKNEEGIGSENWEVRSEELDILGIGVGLNAKFPWAEEAGVELGTGVKANEFLETNVEDIYTAGDCAEYFDIVTGQQVHVGNWMNAQMQGRHAGKILAGVREPFKLVSSYATHVLGMDIIMVGDARLANADEVKIDENEEGRVQIFAKAGKIVGATLINRNKMRGPITKAIQGGLSVSELESGIV